MTVEPGNWTFVDLFSGCGGLSAGLMETRRFDHLYAADFDEWANKTYEMNLGLAAQRLDIAALATSDDRVRWAESMRRLASGRPILLAGGPPCQGFSSHVKTRGDTGGRNQLLGHFCDLAVELRPEVVLVENVADLVASRSWELFANFRRRLESVGYSVRARIINMAQFGVPQERFRTVIIASKEKRPTYPAPLHSDPMQYSTVKDWIGDLPPIKPGEKNGEDPMHVTSKHRAATVEIMRQVPPDGGSRPPGVGPACLDRTRSRHGGYTDVYGRLAWSSPAPTITARCRTPSCGRFVHPEQHRGLTAREAALLQTFPRDWQFLGPFDDRYKQIGNAVPPLAARVIGAHIAEGMPDVAVEAGLCEVGDEPIGSSFSVLIPGIRRRGGVME